ncbi:MAG: hypothetical protein AAF620_12605 [Bacteroidota bacterium]
MFFRRVVLTILLFACWSCRHKTSDILTEPQSIKSTTSTSTKNQQQQVQDTLQPIDLSSLPTDWIRLTETDSSYIIFESCDGGNKLLTINPEDSIILAHGQQQDLPYKFNEVGIAPSSTIYFKIEGNSNMAPFSLKWIDKDNKTAIWTTGHNPLSGPINEAFITNDREGEYTKVKQPCRECWEDEFCDEIELTREVKSTDLKIDSLKVSGDENAVDVNVAERYFPRERETVIFDTLLLERKLRISIHNRYLDSFVINEFESEGIKHLDKYRDSEKRVIINLSNKVLLDTVFNKNDFAALTGQDFLKIADFHAYWFKKIENDTIELFGVIGKPETDWAIAFHHFFDLKSRTFRVEEYIDEEI